MIQQTVCPKILLLNKCHFVLSYEVKTPQCFSIKSSLPASERSAAMRWRWSWQTASGGWPCPGRRCSVWTLRASAKWRTWPTSPASMKRRCCTTWERDTTLAWSMWVHQPQLTLYTHMHEQEEAVTGHVKSWMLCTCEVRWDLLCKLICIGKRCISACVESVYEVVVWVWGSYGGISSFCWKKGGGADVRCQWSGI